MTYWIALCLHSGLWIETVKVLPRAVCEKKKSYYNKAKFILNYKCHSICVSKK